MNPNEDLSRRFKRQTAYKLWISSIVHAPVVEEDGYLAFSFEQLKFLRVNVIGVVIHMFVNEKKDYGFAVLDDGSGQLSFKFWNEDVFWLESVQVGDVVLGIGKASVSSDIFVRTEILKKVDNAWLTLRRKELFLKYGKPGTAAPVAVSARVESVVSPSNLRVRVLDVLEKAPMGGFEIEKVISLVGGVREKVQGLLEELIMGGEVYSPRVGFVKLIG
ncbi:hypothetical protein HY501_02565 [Candidatus Woesearchaeota archaeon]|nr:hypothetical protein [Candidatus Woesearchaeota archaeon]